MPNWCENNLTISGDKKEIKKFKTKAKTKNTALSFNNFYPLPTELKNTTSKLYPLLKKLKGTTDSFPKPKKILIKKYGADNWYNWQIANWGTKWDTSEAELTLDSDDMLEYYFMTAWSPPIAWLEKTAKQFPKLYFKLKYEEPSMGFMGIATASNGAVSDQTINY